MRIIFLVLIMSSINKSHSFLASLTILRLILEEIKESNFASVKLINDYDTLFVKYFNEEVFDKNEALKIAVNRNQFQ
ncbi:hypothetical protein BpHYR1_053622 [Brachionus plicatilis]|uniref:Uncharacterized protein n=1 Tax=Brachionus plicatilis TaxID=10195 RepID=A0A3M7PH60_BRAPC|nr:hypothetical protein BpHYR1_053622 [Brachionus plicatilis]